MLCSIINFPNIKEDLSVKGKKFTPFCAATLSIGSGALRNPDISHGYARARLKVGATYRWKRYQ
jgi:hypothetical protein